MARQIFTNILGVFIFDERFSIIDKRLFEGLSQYESRQYYIEDIKKIYKEVIETKDQDLPIILSQFKRSEFFIKFYERNLELTKLDIKNSVKIDNLLIAAISTIEELDKSINLLVKRLREWYELYNPEISKLIENHEKFINTVIKKSKEEILEQIRLYDKTSMGAEIEREHVNAIINLANHINELYRYKQSLEKYIFDIMKDICPNLLEVAGMSIGSKLIRHAGSFERLAVLPASTIQILGAEKALFRHLTNKKAKMPKYGIIFQHQLISNVQKNERGKAARALSDKISIAVKVDRFRGKHIADQLIKELQKRFGTWN